MAKRAADPQLADPASEVALLGALLLDPWYLREIAWLDSTDFSIHLNAMFFLRFREHWKASPTMDAHTLHLSLLNSGKLEEVGGSARFAELASKAGIPELVPKYARGIRALAEKRRGLRNAQGVAVRALNNPTQAISELRWDE